MFYPLDELYRIKTQNALDIFRLIWRTWWSAKTLRYCEISLIHAWTMVLRTRKAGVARAVSSYEASVEPCPPNISSRLD